MSRKYQTESYQSTREVLVERSCDLCGKIAKNTRWEASCYETNETEISVTVRKKEGENYPEGGQGTEYHVDLCPDCFKEKLIPWLDNQGAKVEEKEWWW